MAATAKTAAPAATRTKGKSPAKNNPKRGAKHPKQTPPKKPAAAKKPPTSAKPNASASTNGSRKPNDLQQAAATVMNSGFMAKIKSVAHILDRKYVEFEETSHQALLKAKQSAVKEIKAQKPAEKAKAILKEALIKMEGLVSGAGHAAGNGKAAGKKK